MSSVRETGNKTVSVKQEEEIMFNEIGFRNVFVSVALKHHWHHN